jgi:hypothetical protein
MIGYKHDKKIYLIKKYVINKLRKRIISCLQILTGARLDVSEKKIIFGNITFQNFITHVTQLQVNLPLNLESVS